TFILMRVPMVKWHYVDESFSEVFPVEREVSAVDLAIDPLGRALNLLKPVVLQAQYDEENIGNEVKFDKIKTCMVNPDITVVNAEQILGTLLVVKRSDSVGSFLGELEDKL